MSGPSSSGSVDLAREPDFDLGDLRVLPSQSRVRGRDRDEKVPPRVMEVLLVLARHRGQTVTRDQLIEACWKGRVVTDDAVTRAIAQVRALTRAMDPPPFELETIPKVGFRLDVASSPPSEDLEPAAVAPRAPQRAWRRPRLRLGLAAVALCALVVAGLWAGLRPQAPIPNGRLEVMAFSTRGDDPVLREVADEVPEMLIHILAGSGIQVAPQPIRPDDGAGDAELRVAGVVERAGDKVVINTHVLDRKTGFVLLSGRYVRSVAAARQSTADIGGILAANLHCALEDRKREGKLLATEALSLLMNACGSVFDESGPYRMLTATRRLVEVAPEFGNGHALHAIAAALAGQQAAPGSPDAVRLYQEAKSAAARALRINPRAAKAYAGLALNEGALSDRLNQDWFAAEQYVLKALAIDPELPPARNEYATLLRSTGRWSDALNYQRAMSESGDARNAGGADPRIAFTMAAKGDVVGAEAQLDRMEATWGQPMTRARQTILFWWADPRDALQRLPKLQDPHGIEPETLGCLLDFLRDELRRAGAPGRGLPRSCDAVDRNWRLRMLGREGDVEGAFALLKGGTGGGFLPFYYPEMRAVRADPRFWDLARDAGLIRYWRRSGRWPDFCREPGLPRDCASLSTEALARSERGRVL
jgi:DNA-binding winged helix-turn-helix (wHTH) protein/TolB-like protein